MEAAKGASRSSSSPDATPDERVTVPAAGLFVLIGAHPHADWLPPGIARDDRGFVLIGDSAGTGHDGHTASAFETTMPGVCAAGDVRHGSMKRAGAAWGRLRA